MTLKIRAEQAIEINKGGGKGGERNKGRVAVSMPTFQKRERSGCSERGKRRKD